MSNILYFTQTKSNNCGAACIAMLASCYGITIRHSQLKHLCKTGLKGTNLKEMINAANSHGIKMRALLSKNKTAALEHISDSPCIAHININLLFLKLKHFVVIQKRDNNRILVYDPDPKKKIYSLSKQAFLKIWTGYLLAVV